MRAKREIKWAINPIVLGKLEPERERNLIYIILYIQIIGEWPESS